MRSDPKRRKKLGKPASEDTSPAAGEPAQAVVAPSNTDPALACAETNVWAPIFPPDASSDDALFATLRKRNPSRKNFRLDLKQFTSPDLAANPNKLGATDYENIVSTGRMSFLTMGCSGDPSIQAPQAAVADKMRATLETIDAPAFLYHLGDIAYKPPTPNVSDNALLDGLPEDELFNVYYRNEFYGAYRGFQRPIFAIPGNHDGKYHVGVKGNKSNKSGQIKRAKSSMNYFLHNFCARSETTYPENPAGAGDPTRPTMTQPYPFFLLETPVADIIGLYTNVCNGGGLDLAKPTEAEAVQYHWLVARLGEIAKEREKAASSPFGRRALLLATHYPPFSGAASFVVRGDPRVGPPDPTAASTPHEPLSDALRAAFESAGIWPDVVLSAHAHHYQRLTYRKYRLDAATNQRVAIQETPFLVVGCGGHGPAEYLWQDCSGANIAERHPPFPAVLPRGSAPLPSDEAVALTTYNDQDFGVVQITIDLRQRLLTGSYQAAYCPEPALRTGRTRSDVFHLNLDTQTLLL